MRLRLLSLLIGCFVLVPSAIGQAADHEQERKISAHLVLDTQSFNDPCPQCGPGGTPADNPRCSYAVFVEFSEVAGAVSYTVVVQDKDPRVNVTRTLSGPPFNDDVEGYKASGGTHRFGGLTGGSGAAPCPSLGDFGGRFEIKKAVAIVDDKLRIAGTVRDIDGHGVGGVPVRIGGRRATTDASGAYSEVVKKGTHVVSAGAGYCVAGNGTCRRDSSVDIRSGTRTVNFDAEAYELTGRVRKVCGAACPANPGIPGVTVTATAGARTFTATTDDQGRYSVKAPGGSYLVRPALDGYRFDPDQQRIKLQSDQKVDFEGCGRNPLAFMAQAPGAYTSPVHPADDDACGEHTFSAKIEKGHIKIDWHGPTECGSLASPFVMHPDLPAVKIVPGALQSASFRATGQPLPSTVTFRVDTAPDGTTTVLIRNAIGQEPFRGEVCRSSFNKALDLTKAVVLTRKG